MLAQHESPLTVSVTATHEPTNVEQHKSDDLALNNVRQEKRTDAEGVDASLLSKSRSKAEPLSARVNLPEHGLFQSHQHS